MSSLSQLSRQVHCYVWLAPIRIRQLPLPPHRRPLTRRPTLSLSTRYPALLPSPPRE